MPFNPYKKYKEESVLNMTPGEMVVRLYDEVIKQLNFAVGAIKEKKYQDVNTALQKSQKIINYLNVTLNDDYEISKNLASLYRFYLERIIEANIKKDEKPLLDIIPINSEKRDAFAKGERLARMGK
jgi:flagellar protein FliS